MVEQQKKSEREMVEETNDTKEGTEQLLAALAEAGRAPSLDLIRTCLEEQEALTPGLLAMLETDPYEAHGLEADSDDARVYGPVHAGHLLIAYEEERALPAFLEIFADEVRGERLIEWFVAGLHNYGQAAVAPFAGLVKNEEAFSYGRAAATEVLGKIGRLYPETRDEVVARLLEVLPSTAEGEPKIIWSWAVAALTDLRASEQLPRIRELYEAGLLDENILGDFAELEESFAQAPEEVRPFNVLDTYRYLHVLEAQERRARTAAERRERPSSEHERKEPGGPTVRTEPKVGRNDPCPCGSGKKYKHCHGRPDR